MANANEAKDAQNPTSGRSRWVWFSQWPPIVKLLPPMAMLVLNASRLPKMYPVARPVLVTVAVVFLVWIGTDVFVNFLLGRSTTATAGKYGFLELLAVLLLVGMSIGLLFH